MKFDFVIGNPPYQDNTIGNNDTYAPPVYDKFLESGFELADKVLMIHPARFLFNAGSTPKSWNEKMLNDEHFKVLDYEEDSSKVFKNTDIKGGLAITYRDKYKKYEKIDIFTPYPLLNTVLHKVKNNKYFKSFATIIVSSYAYHFTEKLYKDIPKAKFKLSKGHEFDLKSNVFSKMSDPFYLEKPKDNCKYLKILGRENNERIYRYIKAEYIKDNVCNLHTYKVFLPGATGTGEFGQTLAPPIIGEPETGATETFLSIGTLNNLQEANNIILYIKTKFARTLLGILKKTQANTPDKWAFVPLQDFTDKSDIDWTKPISDIDRQLYKKYNLSQDEIDFIETNVKEMI